MKYLLRFVVGAIAGLAPFQAALGQSDKTEFRTVVTIKADGSSEIDSEFAQSRSTTMLWIQSWERFMKMEAGGDDLEPADPASTESASVTDEDVRTRALVVLKAQAERQGRPEPKAMVTVSSNEVRIAVTEFVPDRAGAAAEYGLRPVPAGHRVYQRAARDDQQRA